MRRNDDRLAGSCVQSRRSFLKTAGWGALGVAAGGFAWANPRRRELFEDAPLLVAGEGGYAVYRIPGLVIAADGTILAFCEGRVDGPADDGNIDIVLRTSSDGGDTWSELHVVADDGDNTIGNPCPVLDRETGVVWLPFCRNNDTVHLMHSEDHGRTWSDPIEITGDVKRPSWGWYATGPGHGIQLSSGRLLIPCDHREEGVTYSHVIYSDDHGATWQLGGVLEADTNECEVVELPGGRVYINMRSYRGRNRRAVAFSDDGGLTWSEVRDDEALIEPVCQASVVRVHREQVGRDGVLFSNPASTRRENLTIRFSDDGCRTWSDGRLLHAGPSGYSELAVAPPHPNPLPPRGRGQGEGDEGTIFCLYEGGESDYREAVRMARFDLEFVLSGAPVGRHSGRRADCFFATAKRSLG